MAGENRRSKRQAGGLSGRESMLEGADTKVNTHRAAPPLLSQPRAGPRPRGEREVSVTRRRANPGRRGDEPGA